MATGNLTEGEAQTKTLLEELGLSRYLVREFHQESFFFSAVHILLSITAFLGNTLILVVLHKESSLHPSSKLLYCCISCPVVGAEIQRDCNFEAYLYHYS